MSLLADIAPIVLSLGVSAIPVVGGVLSAGVLSQMKSRNLDTMWFETVSRAGGIAYQHLVQSGRPASDKAALVAAAAAGADYLLQRIPGQVKTRSLDATDLLDVSKAELGKLLAQDPTVSPAPATLAPVLSRAHNV